MFDFTPVGRPVAIAGSAFLALAGWRLIPRPPGTGSHSGRYNPISNYADQATLALVIVNARGLSDLIHNSPTTILMASIAVAMPAAPDCPWMPS